jgi:hypothetical protein
MKSARPINARRQTSDLIEAQVAYNLRFPGQNFDGQAGLHRSGSGTTILLVADMSRVRQ